MSRLVLLAALSLPLASPLLAGAKESEQARQFIKSEDFKQAVAVLQQEPSKNPEELELLGQAWIGLKEFGKAVDVLEKAAKMAPGSSMVHMWLGRAWGHRAEANKLMAFSWARNAKSAFEKSVELDPQNMAALDDLFEYYFEAPGIVGGGLDKAEVVAKRIKTIDQAKGERLLARVEKERNK